jgi:thiol-disulfide isomerase/thioredoxin
MMVRAVVLAMLLACALACEDDPVGPMYGRIQVSGWVGDTEVSGPVVLLDGGPTGDQLPADLSHLELGRHTVSLDIQGFQSDPAEAEANLDHGETEEVRFQLVSPEGSGFLWVRSQPAGAAVIVDGSDTGGVTPAVVVLSAGSHTVTVEKSGYTVEPSGPQSVTVPEAGVVDVSFTLTPESSGGTSRVVLAELFTATWCTYCPYSEEAIDQLGDEYGQSYLAVLQYHPTVGADPFGTSETDEREQWYGAVSAGLPQIYFDGVVNQQHSYEETYAEYKAVVDSRLSVPAVLELGLNASVEGDSLTVGVELQPVGDVGEGQFSCRVAVYEDDLDFTAPNGQTHFRYTVRDLLPSWDVTLATAEGRDWAVALDPTWKTGDLGVVAFVQNTATREILQAARRDL